MFEKWANALATQLKNANPEETASHDVLVFGLTIFFNLIFTLILIVLTGVLLGKLWIVIQIVTAFMILRMLTGGAHLDQSLACSLTSLIVVVGTAFLPASPYLIYSYMVIAILCYLRYSPYYEAQQVVHSAKWERKKKQLVWVSLFLALIIYLLWGLPGFILGAFLQAVLVTPLGVSLTYKVNAQLHKGGVNVEKIS